MSLTRICLLPSLLCCAVFWTVSLSDSRADEVFVPPALEEWREWVLQDHTYRQCPLLNNSNAAGPGDFVCAWPGQLEIDVDAERGRFTQSWTVYAEETWLPLPGDGAYWPDSVTADGRSIQVTDRNGTPSVRLGPGNHRFSGQFEWDQRPRELRIPPQSGLIALQVDGRAIENPHRRDGRLFLGEARGTGRVVDAVTTEVYRLLIDDVPTRLTTRIRIQVSGSVREETFAPALPDGLTPLALASQLPARLEADGRLRVQLRPGAWEIALTARADRVLDTLTLPQAEQNLPEVEIWSYRDEPALRVTAPGGLDPVDPRSTDVPDDWRDYPAFRITPGDTLEIVERSRGMAAGDNRLSLDRRLWLNFDGDGFVATDAVSGKMRTGWRLDMPSPYRLLSASERGQELLVTRGVSGESTGVELREADVKLQSLASKSGRGEMPVTGWDTRFASVATTLFLPPGHKLLAAPGVDNAGASWLGRWQLLDLFLLLIITVASWRLFGRTAGLVVLLALGLSFHEPEAPVWSWLNLLAAIALMRVAPAGRLRQTVRTYLALSALTLVLMLVPFLATQLRIAIYPQLEPQTLPVVPLARTLPVAEMQAPASMPAKAARDLAAGVVSSDESAIQEVMVTGQKARQPLARYAPDAILQAGAGMPDWQWNAYALRWAGPVDADQTMRLLILPRWAVTLLRFVEVALLLSFTAILAAEIFRRRWRLPGGLAIGSRSAGILLAGLFLGAGLTQAPDVHAEIPDPDLLHELETRLTAPPDCVPRCAEIADARIDVSANNISMRLGIHALEAVAIPLPGNERGWRPQLVALEGASKVEVLRRGPGILWLHVPAGRHVVNLGGRTGDADSLEIAFPSPPRVVRVSSEGWLVDGVRDRRLTSGALELTRQRQERDTPVAARWESSRFPAFASVRREFGLGLVDWELTTVVERVAPAQGVLTMELPLVEGELVTSDNVTVEAGRVLVSMPAGARQFVWRSTLPPGGELTLSAEDGAPWREIWSFGISNTWRVEFDGVPESDPDYTFATRRMPVFYPRGGESLTMTASRPEAVPGATLAFDSVDLDVEQGVRSSTMTLELDYRSTRGAQHVLRLPEDAAVTEVRIDGSVEPIRAEQGVLTMPVVPGEHRVSVRWQSDRPVGMAMSTPVVDLGAPASNIELGVSLPGNRWLLATSGPRIGPAVLYWSELALLIVFAVVLGRIDWTPLGTRHWLLLGIGFSTFNWPVLGMVIGWLLICGARERWRTNLDRARYNLVQIGIATATVVSLLAIVVSLPAGLLGRPDMHVRGFGSGDRQLSWLADASESVLPVATAWSLPMWTYKTLILAWALWFSFALLRWLPWVWQGFAREGLWRSKSTEAVAGAGDERP